MMMGELTFCEKRKMLKPMDYECWICEENMINGGHCYPWTQWGAEKKAPWEV